MVLASGNCELESIGQRHSFAVIRLSYGYCAGQLSYLYQFRPGLRARWTNEEHTMQTSCDGTGRGESGMTSSAVWQGGIGDC